MGRNWRSIVVLVVLLAVCFSTISARADSQRMALLIGVSDYHRPIRPLDGSKNDVAEMWRLLKDAGYTSEQMLVLADKVESGVPVTAPPTRAAILSALDSLVGFAKSHSGAQLLIYYSGHGSSLPDNDPSASPGYEPDGQDEVYIPIDAEDLGAANGSIKNAIRDDEIAVKIRAMQASGAFVWLVADACHAAGLSRGENDVPGSAIRYHRAAGVGSKGLRISGPNVAPLGTAASDVQNAEGDDKRVNQGKFVGFFAARDDENAIELPLPLDAQQANSKPFGLFTYHLIQTLRTRSTASYQDIALSLVAQMQGQSHGLPGGGTTMPSPVFIGNLGSQQMLGNAAVRQTASVRIENSKAILGAGTLHGITPHAAIDIRAPGAGATLVRAEVASAAPTYATLGAMTSGSGAGDALQVLSSSCKPNCVGVVVDRRPALSLSVYRRSITPGGEAASTNAALAAIEADPSSTGAVAVNVVADAARADVKLCAHAGRIEFVEGGRGCVFDGVAGSASIPEGSASASLLSKVFVAIARARNLQRVASALGSDAASPLKVRSYVQRARSSEPTSGCLDTTGFAGNVPVALKSSSTSELTAERLGQGLPMTLHNCDVVFHEISNVGAKPLVVSPLKLESDYRVTFFGHVSEPDLNVLSPGGTMVIKEVITTRGATATSGVERLIVLGVTRAANEPLGDILFDWYRTPGIAELSRGESLTALPSGKRGAPGTLDGVLAQAFGQNRASRGSISATRAPAVASEIVFETR